MSKDLIIIRENNVVFNDVTGQEILDATKGYVKTLRDLMIREGMPKERVTRILQAIFIGALMQEEEVSIVPRRCK